MNQRYRKTEFLISASKLEQSPPDQGFEAAFVGRSNAGKSSALNALCDHKSLARISKTPGRTQLINFFSVDDERRLVDLPGYGYAKVSEKIKREWQHSMGTYLEGRGCLKGVVLVMDIRNPLKEFDQQMLDWCIYREMACHIILTKADKLKKNAANQALFQVRKAVSEHEELISVQLFSALKKQGIDDVHQVLDRWLEMPTETSE